MSNAVAIMSFTGEHARDVRVERHLDLEPGGVVSRRTLDGDLLYVVDEVEIVVVDEHCGGRHDNVLTEVQQRIVLREVEDDPTDDADPPQNRDVTPGE